MVWIQDDTKSFTISIILEGIGNITSILVSNITLGVDYTWSAGAWSPSVPFARSGDSIFIEPEITNNGAASDTIYGEFVSTYVTPSESLIQEGMVDVGFTLIPSWSFTMPPNAISITINAGHVE